MLAVHYSLSTMQVLIKWEKILAYKWKKYVCRQAGNSTGVLSFRYSSNHVFKCACNHVRMYAGWHSCLHACTQSRTQVIKPAIIYKGQQVLRHSNSSSKKKYFPKRNRKTEKRKRKQFYRTGCRQTKRKRNKSRRVVCEARAKHYAVVFLAD